MSKIRDPYWDNIKGFLIILVVFAHCLYGLIGKDINNLIVVTIYYFHMPAFVFVSGYFSKGENARSRYSIWKLIVAYILISAPFIIRAFYLGASIHILKPYFSAWYILALIIWRLITPQIAKFPGILPIVIVLSVLLGFWAEVNGCKILAINKIVTFFPFFLGGYLLQRETVDHSIRNKPAWVKLCLGAACAILGACIIYVSRLQLDVKLWNLLPNEYREVGWEEPLIRVSIIAVSFFIITAIMFLTTEKEIPYLTKIGRNSLAIYIFHRIFTLWYYNSEFINGLQARYQILGALMLTMAITLFFGAEWFSKGLNGFLNACARKLATGYAGDNRAST